MDQEIVDIQDLDGVGPVTAGKLREAGSGSILAIAIARTTLFRGLELVHNRKSKLAFNTREEKLQGRPMVADVVAAECMKNVTYINSWINCLIVGPPLIIKREEIDQGISALESALGLADTDIA